MQVSCECVVVHVGTGLLVVMSPFQQVVGAEHEAVRAREKQRWRSGCGMIEEEGGVKKK